MRTDSHVSMLAPREFSNSIIEGTEVEDTVHFEQGA